MSPRAACQPKVGPTLLPVVLRARALLSTRSALAQHSPWVRLTCPTSIVSRNAVGSWVQGPTHAESPTRPAWDASASSTWPHDWAEWPCTKGSLNYPSPGPTTGSSQMWGPWASKSMPLCPFFVGHGYDIFFLHRALLRDPSILRPYFAKLCAPTPLQQSCLSLWTIPKSTSKSSTGRRLRRMALSRPSERGKTIPMR